MHARKLLKKAWFTALPLHRQSISASLSSSSTSMPKLGLPYPRAAVATVLANPNRGYLLVKRGNPPGKGKWSLPGGKLELGEETLQGAIREVQEETSLPPEALCFHPSTSLADSEAASAQPRHLPFTSIIRSSSLIHSVGSLS